MGKYRKSLSRRAENMACPVKTFQFPVLTALIRVGLGQCVVALHCAMLSTKCAQKDVYGKRARCHPGEGSQEAH